MISQMKSVFNRQVYSGYASAYLSLLGTLFAMVIVVIDYTDNALEFPRYAYYAILIAFLFSFVSSVMYSLVVVIEPPIFKRPKPILLRVGMAGCVCVATLTSMVAYAAAVGKF